MYYGNYKDINRQIINTQFAMMNAWTSYWTNYVKGFMDTYEREVRTYNAKFAEEMNSGSNPYTPKKAAKKKSSSA